MYIGPSIVMALALAVFVGLALGQNLDHFAQMCWVGIAFISMLGQLFWARKARLRERR